MDRQRAGKERPSLSTIALFTAGAALVGYGLVRRKKAGAGMAVAGGYLIYEGTRHDRTALQRLWSQGVRVQRTIAIEAPAEKLYSFWKDFAGFPRFMQHLRRVEVLDERRSRWTARGPAGTSFTWEAEITAAEENRRIAWASLPGPGIENRGEVEFHPATGDRGTYVRVTLEYKPPAGKLGKAFAALFGEDPEQQVREDLRRFKQLMETGEVPTIEGQPAGHRSAVLTMLKSWHGEGQEHKRRERRAQ